MSPGDPPDNPLPAKKSSEDMLRRKYAEMALALGIRPSDVAPAPPPTSTSPSPDPPATTR